MFQSTRTDDRSSDRRIFKKPGQCDVVLRLSELLAKCGELLQLGTVLLDPLRIAAASRTLNLLQRVAPQQSAVERTPRNYAETEALRCWQHFKLREPAVRLYLCCSDTRPRKFRFLAAA